MLVALPLLWGQWAHVFVLCWASKSTSSTLVGCLASFPQDRQKPNGHLVKGMDVLFYGHRTTQKRNLCGPRGSGETASVPPVRSTEALCDGPSHPGLQIAHHFWASVNSQEPQISEECFQWRQSAEEHRSLGGKERCQQVNRHDQAFRGR